MNKKLLLIPITISMAISSCSTSNVPSFSVEQEDFYFVLTWGVGLDSSYDSRTGTLIKTKYVIERQPEEYIAIYQYPNINEIYEMAKSINVYSYADHYYPYEGSLIMTSPSVNYVFEINDKTITSNGCPITSEIPDSVTKKGKRYLTLIFAIKNTLVNSDEWKAMPDFEILYDAPTNISSLGEGGRDLLNNLSPVCMVTLGNVKYLTCGDAQIAVENTVLNAGIDIKADIWKMQHHGGNEANSLNWVKAISPKYAVYNNGQTSIGNTSWTKGAVQNAHSVGAKVYNPTYHGNIIFTIKGKDINVWSERNTDKY